MNNYLQKAFESFERSEEISKVANLVKVTSTDGSFTQIGVRHKINAEHFYSEGWDFNIFIEDMVRAVVIGEKSFLIKNLLENAGQQENTSSVNIKEILTHVYRQDYDDTIVFAPVDLFYDKLLRDKELGIRYDYNVNAFVFGAANIPIHKATDDALSNKIIIASKDALIWQGLTKKNEKTGINSRLIVDAVEDSLMVDLIVKTVSKIQIAEKPIVLNIQEH